MFRGSATRRFQLFGANLRDWPQAMCRAQHRRRCASAKHAKCLKKPLWLGHAQANCRIRKPVTPDLPDIEESFRDNTDSVSPRVDCDNARHLGLLSPRWVKLTGRDKPYCVRRPGRHAISALFPFAGY